MHCQISNHKELKTTYENNNGNGGGGINNNNNGTQDLVDCGGETHLSAGTTTTPSPVIRVVVESQLYPVTIDALYSIFSRAGKVLKIVTFTKNNSFQALIQFCDVTSSIQAKHCLDGQTMFQSANVLRIEYSKLQNLVVKYNNDKSRDYTQATSNGTNAQSVLSLGYGTSGATSATNGSDSVQDLNSILNPASLSFSQTANTFAASLNGHSAASNAFGQRYMGAATLQQAFTNAALNGGMISPMFAAAAATGIGVTGLVMSPVIHVSGLSEVSPFGPPLDPILSLPFAIFAFYQLSICF